MLNQDISHDYQSIVVYGLSHNEHRGYISSLMEDTVSLSVLNVMLIQCDWKNTQIIVICDFFQKCVLNLTPVIYPVSTCIDIKCLG